ncbi:MAG: hypothetical protein RLZZ453_321 [Chlamydiota bacterium]|jgi:L-threonylcarbamoyladenylate synthase
MTELLTTSELPKAAALLKQGHLVAFPTETVYGLGAALCQEEAILQIYAVKGRPSDNPLIVHVSAIEQVEAIAVCIPSAFYKLATAFWPGPLTVVLPKHPSFCSVATAGLNSVAVRMPSCKVALELISQVGSPVVAPSANLSGKPSPTEAAHVLQDLEGEIAAVIDGGPSLFGIESTVVSLLEGAVQLLRPGSIHKEALEEVLGCKIEESISTQALAPGMKYRHYAPKCPVFLVETEEELLLTARSFQQAMILSGNPHPLSEATLYRTLRLADEKGCDAVIVLLDKALLLQPALMNRLKKAEFSV